MYYDNEVAVAFARAVAESDKHRLLNACLGVTWQIVSMRRRVSWYHEYSHTGLALNELADSLVAHAAFVPAARLLTPIACSRWCDMYTENTIKLMYLLHLPAEFRDLYPRISDDKSSIAAPSPSSEKWGLEAEVIAAHLDVIAEKPGKGLDWQAVSIDMLT